MGTQGRGSIPRRLTSNGLLVKWYHGSLQKNSREFNPLISRYNKNRVMDKDPHAIFSLYKSFIKVAIFFINFLRICDFQSAFFGRQPLFETRYALWAFWNRNALRVTGLLEMRVATTNGSVSLPAHRSTGPSKSITPRRI